MMQSPKKVLINALNLTGQYSGVHYYISNLLTALGQMAHSNFSYAPILPNFVAGNSNHGIKPGKNISDVANSLRRICFENFIVQHIYKRGAFDLYHSPCYVLPYFWKKPSIVTVHDVISLDFPALCKTSTALYYKLLLERSCAKATSIITVSEKVKEDILNRFDVPEGKVNVIHLGISPTFKKSHDPAALDSIRRRYNLQGPYILFVGNIEPKKNLTMLLTAFSLLKTNRKIEHKLVIVGRKAWKYKSVFHELARLKLEPFVQFLGYVPECHLPGIYSMADVFVFPSLYEGFGLPPLEAMACEIPVVVSSSGALPEITGNYCVQVDPFSPESLAFEIQSVLDGKYPFNLSDAAKWASQFTWEKTACATHDLYARVLA